MNFTHSNTLIGSQDFTKAGEENIKYIPLLSNLFYVDMFNDWGEDIDTADKDKIIKLKGAELGGYTYYNGEWGSEIEENDTRRLFPVIDLENDHYVANNIKYISNLILREYNIKDIYREQNYILNSPASNGGVDNHYAQNKTVIQTQSDDLSLEELDDCTYRASLRFRISALYYNENILLSSQHDNRLKRAYPQTVATPTANKFTLRWREDQRRNVINYHLRWRDRILNKMTNSYLTYNYTQGEEKTDKNSDYGKIMYMNAYMYARVFFHTPEFIIVFHKVLPDLKSINYTFNHSTTPQLKEYTMDYTYGEYTYIPL